MRYIYHTKTLHWFPIKHFQYAYTAAIIVLTKSSSKRWKAQAIALLDEMDSKHIEPNTYTYTAAFHAVDGGKAALELLNRAKRSSVHSESETVEGAMSMPMSINLYNGAIHACSRSSDIDGKNNGWQADVISYNSLLSVCNDPNEANIILFLNEN